jgi:hypothetical protein
VHANAHPETRHAMLSLLLLLVLLLPLFLHCLQASPQNNDS